MTTQIFNKNCAMTIDPDRFGAIVYHETADFALGDFVDAVAA